MTSHGTDEADIGGLLDESRIVRAVGSYFRYIDDREFAGLPGVLAPDARLIRPNGEVTVGAERIAASHAGSFARFEATQHLLAGHHVQVDGDAAVDRVDLVAVHVWKGRPPEAGAADRSFTAGDVVTARLVRTPLGWRIGELAVRVVWRTGSVGDMPDTR